MFTLEQAIETAARAHAGQVDKAGQPYILHPLRVMLAVEMPTERITAVLHDVVEDTTLTFNTLKSMGVPADILIALDALTKRDGESRLDTAERTATNAIARKVKLADLADNMNLARIAQPSAKDLTRQQAYEHVRTFLQTIDDKTTQKTIDHTVEPPTSEIEVVSEDNNNQLMTRRQARALALHGDFIAAALAFTALSEAYPADLDLYLQVARCYREGKNHHEAADWYYKTACRYVDMGLGVQSVALLSIYRDLRPEDIEGCRTLFRKCRTQTNEPQELIGMLSDQDQACYSMRYGEFFSVLDDESFDTLLDSMKVHELQEGDFLVHNKDPADSLYLVADGTIQASMKKDGKRIILGTIHTGGVCGEIPFFIGGHRRTGDLIASKAARVVEVPYSLLRELEQQSEVVVKRIDRLYRRHLLGRQLALTAFFRPLDATQRQLVEKEMEAVAIRTGGALFCQGERSCDLYLIRSGTLGLYVLIQGQEKLMKTFQAGATVGEVAVLYDGLRTASIRAHTDCILMRWRGEDYLRSYLRNKSLQRVVAARMASQQKEARCFIQKAKKAKGEGDEDGIELTMKMKMLL